MFTKIIFNLFVKIKMPIDVWTAIDGLCGILNMICFSKIRKIQPENILNSEEKSRFDYFLIAIVIVAWIRFFSYFLVI